MNSRKLDFQIRNILSIFCLMLFGLSVNSFAAPGDLDLSFGSGGKVLTNVNNGGSALASAIQADGKIVVVGTAGGDFAVARYNPDGSLDSSFSGGIVITPITAFDDQANAVAIQADGKIVVVGTGNNPKPYENQSGKCYVVRYNPDGSLDTSFGGSGIIVVFSGFAYDYGEAVVIQPDGKILIGSYGTIQYPEQFTITRLNSDGTLDNSFDGDGRVVTAFTQNYNRLSDMLIQPDGKIIAVGYSGGFRLVRFNTDGSFDADFGSSGQVIYSTSGGTPKIVRQTDGKIIVADLYVGGLILVRFDVNGMLDTSFGTNGSVITPTQSKLNSTSDIALQKNGKILVVGVYFRQPIPPFGSDFSVFRFNPNGSLDTSFGNAGIVLTRFDGSQYDIARTLVIQPNGKIVVAGSSLSDVSKFALVRYEGDQNIRPSFDFDGDGKSDISVYRPSSGVWYLLNSSSGFTAAQFGVSTDKIVPADYDGDGKTDIAVYRSGTWYLSRSSAGFTGIAFGEASDIPQPADFDGDGKAELAVYRPSNGTWYVLNLAANHHSNFQFGASTDKPVIADYDGDGKADYAVYRPSSGTWYLQRSTAGFTGVQFGEATDKPVPADYDGDGKTDIAVFRPSNGVWYLNRSTQGFTGIQFGVSTDLPTPADYDGDGKADIAVFRNGTWYLQQTTAGFTGVGFGESTDKPVPNTFVP